MTTAAAGRRTAHPALLGLAGLLFVVPIAALLTFGAGSAQSSALILGPIVTSALAVVAMVAFWWDDWPGTSVRPLAWSGWVDTAFIAVVAVALTLFGQLVVGQLDLRGVFDAAASPAHTPSFPAVLPLAGTAFAVMLQLTLVCEARQLLWLPRVPAGIVALALSWAVAVALYYAVVEVEPAAGSGVRAHDGFISPGSFGALLTVIGVWQVWWYITWRAWPFSTVTNRAVRISLGNLVIIGGGALIYAFIRRATDLETETITAGAGALIAAGLSVSMLFEDAVRPRLSAAWDRVVSVAVIVVLAAAFYAGLTAFARTQTWTRVTPAQWVTYATVAWSVSVILHTAVGRRWPFGTPE